jgi:long-chain-alcohol oxidase
MAEAANEPAPKLSPRQLSALKGIIDALMPSLAPPDDGTVDDQEANESLRRFWEHDLSSNPYYLAMIETTILRRLPPMESFQLGILLYLLSTVIGSALVLGSIQPIWTLQAFGDFSTDERFAALRNLQHSRFQEKRKIFNGLKRLICALAYSFVQQDNEKQTNPYWASIGYDGPCHWKLSPQEDARRIRQGGLEDFRQRKDAMIAVTQDMDLEVDVVIVGSGSGGGVAADVLVSAGYSVIVVEKGPYVAPKDLTHLEADALSTMYEASALLSTSDGNIGILAASTLGGGTTINWSCCLPLPEYVRAEWVNKYKLKQFHEAGDFDISLAVVAERIGCTNKASVKHNMMNQKLRTGCEALNYKWTSTGQNLINTTLDENGSICFGDRYGNRQSGLMTFLGDSVKKGARIIDNCNVKHIVQGIYIAPTGTQRRRALGIVGYVGDAKVSIRARKCVVSAAGALHTPCLLQRSLLSNPHIGRHLHLHPVIAAIGIYKKEAGFIDCHLGSPMTGVCYEFEDGPQLDGYGSRIECPCVHPGLGSAVSAYIDPMHFRQKTLMSRSGMPLIVLQRDCSEGKVQTSDDGCTPKIDYVVCQKDKESMIWSLQGAVRILIASGSIEVTTCHMNDCGFVVPPLSDVNREEKIQAYLDRIKGWGLQEHETSFMNAHQMGSCRMSDSPQTGAVDSNGEAWDCDDLYVVDTSIFPTASGANPMLTVLTLSHMLSTRLAARLRHEDGKLTTDPEYNSSMDKLRMCRLETSQYVRWTRMERVCFVFVWGFVVLLATFWWHDRITKPHSDGISWVSNDTCGSVNEAICLQRVSPFP